MNHEIRIPIRWTCGRLFLSAFRAKPVIMSPARPVIRWKQWKQRVRTRRRLKTRYGLYSPPRRRCTLPGRRLLSLSVSYFRGVKLIFVQRSSTSTRPYFPLASTSIDLVRTPVRLSRCTHTHRLISAFPQTQKFPRSKARSDVGERERERQREITRCIYHWIKIRYKPYGAPTEDNVRLNLRETNAVLNPILS